MLRTQEGLGQQSLHSSFGGGEIIAYGFFNFWRGQQIIIPTLTMAWLTSHTETAVSGSLLT